MSGFWTSDCCGGVLKWTFFMTFDIDVRGIIGRDILYVCFFDTMMIPCNNVSEALQCF
jgi:hypothetical protein